MHDAAIWQREILHELSSVVVTAFPQRESLNAALCSVLPAIMQRQKQMLCGCKYRIVPTSLALARLTIVFDGTCSI